METKMVKLSIKQLIQKFRINTDPEDYCRNCPFTVKNNFGDKFMCSYCSEIFKICPPAHNSIWKKDTFGKYRYLPARGINHICPCKLYGEEYVSKKIAKFMDE